MEPTRRFTGLAATYTLGRPSYPDSAVKFIISKAGLTERSKIADIGCGTGISSRLFAQHGFEVVGIEPNDDMLSEATSFVEDVHEENIVRPIYKKGGAENTGLPSQSVQLVISAQAFHWFKPDEAIKEFSRILTPAGWIALIWNERNHDDAFTRDYGTLIESFPDSSAVERKRSTAGNALLESDLVTKASLTFFDNSQTMDFEGLRSRAFSSSYIPRESPGKEVVESGLIEIFAKHQSGGAVTLHYKTSVYLAQII